MYLKLKTCIKKYLFMLLFIIGAVFCGFDTTAAPESIYSFITEFTLNGETWKYGARKAGFVVESNAPISVEYTLFFTAEQWREQCETLLWEFPDGIDIMHVNEHVTAVVDGETVNIGTMSISDSQIQISVQEEYKNLISWNNNIELRAGAVLEFEEGVYDLGEIVVIEAKESGQANARWNGYSIKVNKIDANDDSKLLEGAIFEIQEAEYSENAHEFQEGHVWALIEHHVLENNTFIYSGDGFCTVENIAALLQGSFEPGNLYCLNELLPPVGYLPSAEPTKFAFYHYTDSEKQGTLNKIDEFNAVYEERYEAEGGVAVFKDSDCNIYVKNSKAPGFRVLKLDAMTGEPIADVTFTLRINVQQAEYSINDYLALENAGWTYNDLTGVLEWTQKTDAAGVLSYPAGTIPYASAGYELVENVPEGYVGHGSVMINKFVMTANGTIEILSGAGVVEMQDGEAVIKVTNEKTADVLIMKKSESGQPLEGAVFAIYGKEQADTEDTIEKGGVVYYYQQSKTSDSDGKAEFANLRYGTYYLVEKQAPEGYQLLEDAYRVELSEETLDEGVYELEIINSKKGVEIVSTGGKGIWPYITVAAVLAVIGTAFFLVAKRKEKIRRKKRAAAMRRKNEQKKKKN